MAHVRTSANPHFRSSAGLRRLALGIAILSSPLAPCQPAMPDYQIKAAFLYHFTQFIEWPTGEANEPLVICVAGDNALRRSVGELTRGKVVGSRAIEVREIKEPEETHTCHLMFLTSALNPKLPRYLAAVRALDVLTVGEPPGFLDRGGMIELFLEDNRIRFDINEQALRDAHLRASSRLLRLARRIEPARAGGAP
jgi:hypothetical protein